MVTREELEAEATELGITFPSTIKDETLARKIEAFKAEKVVDEEIKTEVLSPIATPKAMEKTSTKVISGVNSAYKPGEYTSGNATILRN